VTDPAATLLAEIDGLSKTWADGAGLAPCSLELHTGELLVVRGRSGSGKSTLLALLAGWAQADAGRITRLGAWGGEAWMTWRGTAILPQVMAPIAELTTAENVALPLRLAGERWPAAHRRAEEMLAALDLTAEAHRPATEASMGQQQRMALARAAVIAPVVLLADEPTSHQDAGRIQSVLRVLRQLVHSGTCAVVASHDPAVADAADRVLDLDRS
jgi:ABC-type lipoprotein export system ATPase subunit